MSRIGTYDNDRGVERTDRVFGTNSSNSQQANFTLADLSDFFKSNSSDVTADGFLTKIVDNSVSLSIARDTTQVVRFGNLFPSTVAGDVVYATNANTIFIGANLNAGFFANPLLVSGARIIFVSNTSRLSHSSTITGFDSTASTITVADNIPNNLQVNAGTIGDGANLLLLLGSPSISISGDLDVDGTISGTVSTNRFINIRDNQQYSLWLGTESQYQTELAAGNVRTDVLYLRT